MRCVAYGTADSYRMTPLVDYFRSQNANIKRYRNFIHVTNGPIKGDLFCFNSGCFITWGLTSAAEAQLLQVINQYANKPLSVPEIDYVAYRYGDKTLFTTHDRFNIDIIILERRDNTLKLAISYALAQSIKLSTYENAVQKTIHRNRSLPVKLAQLGKITLTRKAISKRIGEIFLASSTINLQSEFLDTPEFFWEYPAAENHYIKTKQFFDIDNRATSLNHRLGILRELLDMLNSQLQDRHSSMLEMIIIVLIVVEILINIVHWV